jgi:hypothetical protein
MVVGSDQRVETAVVQVTLDNSPPSVNILQPRSGEAVTLTRDGTVVFQVQAEDDTAVQKVDYYVDGELWASTASSTLHGGLGGRQGGAYTDGEGDRPGRQYAAEKESTFTIKD